LSAAPRPLAGFEYRYEPAPDGSRRTLLLLHGTGGDQHDLIPLGQALDPGAALLSPRGKVLEHGMPRFFRRIAEGVFDLEDLARRTDELAAFVAAAVSAYSLDSRGMIAVGFSNGANIGASLLLRRPEALSGAVLFRAMLPYDPGDVPELSGRRVFLSAGRRDPIAPAEQAQRLAERLRGAGADVTLRLDDGAHGIGPAEVDAARDWLAGGARTGQP
jgi:phospholipase/carboxylesterase